MQIPHAYNRTTCRDLLFPTAVAERLLVNVWRWA